MNSEIKKQVYNIIDELIILSEWISEWIIKNKEVDVAFSWNIKKIYILLEKDSFEYRKFDNWKITNYHTIWTQPRHAEEYAKWDKSILDLISILKQITLYNNIEDEKHFKTWDEYKIYRYIFKIFQKAERKLLIVDSYMDANIFDYIEEQDDETNINILTSTKWCKKLFKTLYFSNDKENLKVRLHDDIHDRYVVIDNKEIYLIWTSFNHMWKKDFSIKKLDNTDKITDLNNIWDMSKELSKV